MNNDTLSPHDPPSDLHQYVLWTMITCWIMFFVALLLGVYISNYFRPVADYYDDCGPADVKFLYTVRLRTKDLPPSLLTNKNAIVVILENRKECICRWILRLKGKESVLSALGKRCILSRLKFKVGRSSLLRDVESVRLEHNSYGNTIRIEYMDIVDRSSRQPVFCARISEPISMLPVICGDDKRQVFPVKALTTADSPAPIRDVVRRKISLTEYLIFTCFAVNLLLVCSLHFPHAAADIVDGKGIANGFVAAIIAMTITFSAFALYKLPIRQSCHPLLVTCIVLVSLLVISITLSVVAVSDSESGSGSAGAWWLSGFIGGFCLILIFGLSFIYLLSIVTSSGREKADPHPAV